MCFFWEKLQFVYFETWYWNSSFKYFQVIRIEVQILSFVVWKKLWLDNFVLRSTDLYIWLCCCHVPKKLYISTFWSPLRKIPIISSAVHVDFFRTFGSQCQKPDQGNFLTKSATKPLLSHQTFFVKVIFVPGQGQEQKIQYKLLCPGISRCHISTLGFFDPNT